MHGIEEANLIYLDLISEKYFGTSGDASMSKIANKLIDKDYEIEKVIMTGKDKILI